jgi:phage FluMu protein Com
MERCWNCNQVRRGVEFCPSEDRLCPDCYKANERQLKDQHVIFTDTVAAVMPDDKSAASFDVVSRGLDDVVQNSADIKKTKSKPAKGKRNKDDSTPVQQRHPTADDVTAHSAVLTQH